MLGTCICFPEVVVSKRKRRPSQGSVDGGLEDWPIASGVQELDLSNSYVKRLFAESVSIGLTPQRKKREEKS